MIVLCILVFIYFIFNITSIVNVFMLSIEKKQQSKQTLERKKEKPWQSNDKLVLKNCIVLILRFLLQKHSKLTNKQNQKNIWTSFYKNDVLDILTYPMRNTFEGNLIVYFSTDVFMQFLKILKMLFCFLGQFLTIVIEKTFTLLLKMKVHLFQKLRLNISKISNKIELKGPVDNLVFT